MSKHSRCNALTVWAAQTLLRNSSESLVHISPPERRLCTARQRKLSRLHKAHCISRTCKLSWRRSVQHGPKRSWVFTLQSVHCLSAHFTHISATHKLSPSATDSIFTSELTVSLHWRRGTFFPLQAIYIYSANHKKKNKNHCCSDTLYSQMAWLKNRGKYSVLIFKGWTRKLQ